MAPFANGLKDVFYNRQLAILTVWEEIKKTSKFALMLVKKTINLESVVICPKCGHQKSETMATDSCLYFYQCENCLANLKPLPGDCCIFCSYGSVKCPPIQAGESCC
jgi:hypothetical protein